MRRRESENGAVNRLPLEANRKKMRALCHVSAQRKNLKDGDTRHRATFEVFFALSELPR